MLHTRGALGIWRHCAGAYAAPVAELAGVQSHLKDVREQVVARLSGSDG